MPYRLLGVACLLVGGLLVAVGCYDVLFAPDALVGSPDSLAVDPNCGFNRGQFECSLDLTFASPGAAYTGYLAILAGCVSSALGVGYDRYYRRRSAEGDRL